MHTHVVAEAEDLCLFDLMLFRAGSFSAVDSESAPIDGAGSTR